MKVSQLALDTFLPQIMGESVFMSDSAKAVGHVHATAERNKWLELHTVSIMARCCFGKNILLIS